MYKTMYHIAIYFRGTYEKKKKTHASQHTPAYTVVFVVFLTTSIWINEELAEYAVFELQMIGVIPLT